MTDTFVARRWNNSLRAYVDSKNNKIQIYDIVEPTLDISITSKSPSDGSRPFLALPTELRLQIYGYLTDDRTVYVNEFFKSFDITANDPIKFAYLYRSPGRVTKPNAISKQVIHLFHVCRQMRVELIDTCFNDRIFILEACLYQREAAGLCVIPSRLGPTAWVKRLLLITFVELDDKIRGIADLRPLQQMTNLRELHILFSVTERSIGCRTGNILDKLDNVMKAALQRVPKTTTVHFRLDESFRQSLLCQLYSLHHLFENTQLTESALEFLIENMALLNEGKGSLSGSVVNHALCHSPTCQEGLDCVNSHFQLPMPSSSHRKVSVLSKCKIKRAIEGASPGDEIERPELPEPEIDTCVHDLLQCCPCKKGFVRKLKCSFGWHLYDTNKLRN